MIAGWVSHPLGNAALSRRAHTADTRLTGNDLAFRVAALFSRRASICLITARSSILAIILTAPPHAAQADMSVLNTRFRRCAFMPSGAAHDGMLHQRRSLVAGYLASDALAEFRRRHQGTMLTIWCEHTMEVCLIGSRPGYQGCQEACDKVQWLEDKVGSVPFR